MLQCVAVFRSVRQCFAVCCCALQRVYPRIPKRQYHDERNTLLLSFAMCCSVVQFGAESLPFHTCKRKHLDERNILVQCVAVLCTVLQYCAVCCSVLQRDVPLHIETRQH